jgi:hypothetical protein
VDEAAEPAQLTLGDRVTLLKLAAHAKEIEAKVTKILQSGVLSS